MNSTIPAFLVASPSVGLTECKTWRQSGPKPLFIHEVSAEQLSSFPGIIVEKVLGMDFAQGHKGPSYPYCYALPLLAGQTEAHREYCRQAMNENREPTEKACRTFGMLSLHKWIQITERGAYVLYYQEMISTVEECRKKFLSLQDDEKALIATRLLREQTGCSFIELCPHTVLNRFQEPTPPFPYLVEEVSYGNTEVSLSGTLTLPKTAGPFPAVILIHGSSRLDRDETMLGHKPFLVLSDHFTRHGIAVLRFDKRGVGKSTGNYDKATIEDFCDDVAKGVEYLKSRPEIRKNQIGLVGHSEGGIVAPMLTAKSHDVAFIVLMAGTGVNGEEIFCEQGRILHRAAEVDEEMIAIDTQIRKIVTGIIKKEPNRNLAKEQIDELLAKFLSGLTENQKKWVNSNSIITEDWVKRFNSPWGHFYFSYEPAAALRQITIPVLALNGDLDLVVSPKQNLPRIDKALKEAGNQDYTIIELPKLNHAFQTCEIGTWDEYEQIEETVAPSALKIMTDWILERTAKKISISIN